MMMNKLLLRLLLAAVTAGCVACDKTEPVDPRPTEPRQTIMVYLSGQSLARYFTQNVNEIASAVAGSDGGSRVLIFSEPRSGAVLIECKYRGKGKKAELDTLHRYTREEFSSSIQRDDIAKILNEMAGIAPAGRYGLIIGSHGGGWLPAEYRLLDDFGGKSPFSLRPRREGDPLLYKQPDSDATRWFGEESGRVGEIEEWAAGIQAATPRFGYVIFDACFMSNIETLYEFRNIAPYIVASPCEIMGRGVPYDRCLPALLNDTSMQSGASATVPLAEFCRAFHNYYSTTSETRQSGCLAITCTAEIDKLAAAAKAFNATVTAEPDPMKLQIYEGLHQGATRCPLFFDLRQYIEQAECSDETVRSAALEQLDRTAPKEFRLHTPQFYTGYDGMMHDIDYYSGVTTSAPTAITAYAEALRQTAWWKATH